MKLLIPTLGAVIRLNQDWEFKLYFESRNATVLAALLNGSKKIEVPWSRYFEELDAPKSHQARTSDWYKTGMEQARKMIGDFKNAGYTVYTRKKEYDDETSKSFKQQIQLPHILATLPAGTMLSFDRYYIRQGAEAFDSVTFKIEKCPDPKFNMSGKACRRFWARLQEVNEIDCELLG
jgi:hypothetical protein